MLILNIKIWYFWRLPLILLNEKQEVALKYQQNYQIISQLVGKIYQIHNCQKTKSKILNVTEMHTGALYAFNLMNSKLLKWFVWINAYIQHQNIIFFEATLSFTK